MNKMNDEYLINLGYKQFEPIKYFDSDIVVSRFQKCFKDDFGKKYFINVIKYQNDYIPPSHRTYGWQPYSYEYEMHITMYEDEKSLDLKFGIDWELNDIEKFAYDFFDKMKPNYYESWQGDKLRPDFDITL